MEAYEDEDDAICIGEEYGTISGIDTETTESEQCPVEDAGPELGTEEEDGAAAGDDLEVVQDKEDEDIEGVDDGKDDDNMVVVDELDNDDSGNQKSAVDEDETVEPSPILDAEVSEFHLLRMPGVHTVTSDMKRLRRSRQVSVCPLTLADVCHADMQNILDSDRCEEVKFQMVRPTSDTNTWAGFLTFMLTSSKGAASVIEELKSFKEGLTVKLDTNPYQSLQSFVQSKRTSAPAALPANWTKKLVFVRGLCSKTSPDELEWIFPGADEIVVAQDTVMPPKRLKQAVKKGEDGYAYILYNDEETAKSVADEYTQNPPVFLKHALDVKLYREPKEIPKGLLLLRVRRVILRHLQNITRKADEKSKNNPDYKMPLDSEKRIARCKEVIEKDDKLRRQFDLPTPSLADYNQIHGLKPMKPNAFNDILDCHGISEGMLPKNPERMKMKKARRGLGRGRGQPATRARGGFGRGQPPARARGTFVRGFRGRGVGRPFPAAGGYSQSMEDLQASARGMVDEIKRLIQQPMMGSGEGHMMSPMMNPTNMGMARGRGMMAGAGPGKRPFGRGMGGARGGHGEPPPKWICMDEPGGFPVDPGMHMYEPGDQFGYDNRPMFPQHSHNTEYLPPPTRNQPAGRGGMLGPSRGFGGPRGYENTDLGGAGTDYDINLLMNISKMLTSCRQNVDQSRHQMY